MERLYYPKGTRRARLLDALDINFTHYLSNLPQPLNDLAKRNETFLGSRDESLFEGAKSLNPVLAGTPWLFWEQFRDLEDDIFLSLAEAGTSFVLASIVLDHLVDNQSERPDLTSLLHQALYAHGIERYRSILPSSSRFWGHFDRLASDHLQGLASELNASEEPRKLIVENLATMAYGKVSPIIVTIAAFTDAAGQQKTLQPIEESLKFIAIASQLLDDIGDWKYDLEVGHLTYFLSRLAPPEAWQANTWPAEGRLQRQIDQDWIDVESLRVVKDYLEKSLIAVRDLACEGWVEYIEGYLSLTEGHLEGAVARHLSKVFQSILSAERD